MNVTKTRVACVEGIMNVTKTRVACVEGVGTRGRGCKMFGLIKVVNLF